MAKLPCRQCAIARKVGFRLERNSVPVNETILGSIRRRICPAHHVLRGIDPTPVQFPPGSITVYWNGDNEVVFTSYETHEVLIFSLS